MDKLQFKRLAIDLLAIIGTIKILSIVIALFNPNTQAALQTASPHPVFKTPEAGKAIEDVGKAAASSDTVPVAGAASVADETAFQGIDLAGFLL